MAAQVAFKVLSISLPEGRLQMPKLARTPIGSLQRHEKNIQPDMTAFCIVPQHFYFFNYKVVILVYYLYCVCVLGSA